MERPKVLVVDDNVTLASSLRRLLNMACRVEASFVGSGEEAVEAIRQQLPDVVLLDLIMPGMSGFDQLRHLRSRPDTQNLPVIVHSAFDSEENRAESLELGANGFIVKATQVAEICRSIRECLRPTAT